MTIHSPEEIRVALARRFRRASHVALPERTADDAMVIVREVLDERDRELAAQAAEIELLRSRLAALEDPALDPRPLPCLPGTVLERPPRRVGAESN